MAIILFYIKSYYLLACIMFSELVSIEYLWPQHSAFGMLCTVHLILILSPIILFKWKTARVILKPLDSRWISWILGSFFPSHSAFTLWELNVLSCAAEEVSSTQVPNKIPGPESQLEWCHRLQSWGSLSLCFLFW